jgi:hypothetical protein
MRPRRPLAAGLTFLGFLGSSVVLAQRDGTARSARALDPSVTAVRLLLGVGDGASQPWGGRVKLDRGEVLGVDGWRFREGDQVNGRDAWKARSLPIRKAAGKAVLPAPASKTLASGPSTFGAAFTPTGVVVSMKAPDDATLTVETDRGNFEVKLDDLRRGSPREFLDGKAVAQRVPPSVPLVEGPDQEDYPAAVGDGQGGAWLVYVTHKPNGPVISAALEVAPKDFSAYAPKGGGDQIKLIHVVNGTAASSTDVTGEGLDVWRPAVALDGKGGVVVVWSENRGGNFDLYQRRFDPQLLRWSDVARLTTNPGTDTQPALATTPDGNVWVAWQSWFNGQADVWLGRAEAGAAGARQVSDGPGNDWSPALAADGRGNLYVAYDTYQAGNYDVHLKRCGTEGAPGPAIAVANSPRFEVRPSLAVDPRGRVWVAYEERTENWGKDAENMTEGQGTTLYRKSAVRVRCLDGDQLLDAPDPVAESAAPDRLMNSFPRLACDARGRVWLAFRHRQEAIWGQQSVMVVGGVWVEHVTSLGGGSWEPPLPLPRSDGLLDNRPALVTQGDGPLLVAYNSDGRLHREVEFKGDLAWKYYSHSGTPPEVVNNDLFLAAVTAPTGAADPATIRAVPQELAPAVVHADEAADVARMRNHRIVAGGKTYRFFRGDFHRHTEISQDGGNDGALEDMWRYAIDAASFDWMGDADHDNGGGKEYTWWLVQKSTDLYNSPSLVTLFTYERSVAYPNGHRNVMFPKRGVRTLPRLVRSGQVVDDDTDMLYAYLKEHGGICASHTSATGMGTDWRDVDPAYEPMVEIYQGHRNSYEHFGAPRVARRPNEAIGGWRPLGMVWNALSMQYKLGFQASSDHISTHISYAVAVAEEGTRDAVVDAFRRRHCYGATDNIVMDVRSGEHLMGDEFDADGPVKLKVLVHGTRPIARLDVIKDFVYAFSTEPNRPRVEFEWSDGETSRPEGLSWYYVRAIQDDGQLAWASPLWVRSGPRGGRPLGN